MRALGTVAACAAALVVVLSAGAEAGSVPLDHGKPEISPKAALKFYEYVVRLWEAAPVLFDRVHPLAGRLLASERVYEELLEKWESHPARFEHNHECVWRLLYGDLIHHTLHHSPLPVPITLGNGSPPGLEYPYGNPPPGGGSGNPPPGGGPGNPPPGGSLHITSVPEPSAGALMASGLVMVVIAAARGHAYNRCKAHRAD
jgi:hypothetical protein